MHLPIKNKKGFTLIEIIVVLIILGVLLSVAVTSLFSWIQRSHAAPVLVTMKNLKDEFVLCLRTNRGNENICFPGNTSLCSGYGATENCEKSVTINGFTYYLGNKCASSAYPACDSNDRQGWYITAQENFSDVLRMAGNGNDANFYCQALGIYKGVC